MFRGGEVYANGNITQIVTGADFIDKHLDWVTQDDLVVDLGCGTGETTKFLAEKTGAEVTAIDCDTESLNYARINNNHPKIIHKQVNLQNKKWFWQRENENRFSAGICLYVLHWVPDFEQAMRNIYQIMRPGGRLLIIQHYGRCLSLDAVAETVAIPKWKKLIEKANFEWKAPLYKAPSVWKRNYQYMYDREALKALVTACGFKFKFHRFNELPFFKHREQWRPILPVLNCLTLADQEEFIDDFLEILSTINSKTTKNNLSQILYELIKE